MLDLQYLPCRGASDVFSRLGSVRLLVFTRPRGREMACRRACCQGVNRSVVIKWACSASPGRRCAHGLNSLPPCPSVIPPRIKTARRYERRRVCFGLPLSRESDDGVFDDSGAVHAYLRGPSCGLDLSLDKFAYFPLIPIYFTFEIDCVSCIPAIPVREPRHIRHTVYTVASKTWPWF